MKIGILTLPLHTNYGGILQAYALQMVLKRLGHEAYLIEHKREFPKPQWYLIPAMIIRRAFMRYYRGDKEYSLFGPGKTEKRIVAANKFTWEFADKNFIIKYHNYDLRTIGSDTYDAIIVGSDQIWRKSYIKGSVSSNVCDAFLEFAKTWNIKRIAYAASFGTDDNQFTHSETAKISELLKKFDAISVREKSGVDICQKLFNVNAVHVLDPTMLIDSFEYQKLVQKQSNKKGRYLSCYFLDYNKEKENIADLVAKNKGLDIYHSNSKIDSANPKIPGIIQPPVEDWINSFIISDFIITDSFHACVFSIIFCKPFIVFGNIRRGMARFESLLAMFNLQSRLIKADTDVINVISEEIEWKKIKTQLDEYRDKSLSFLANSLL